jgi:hypothetical protein
MFYNSYEYSNRLLQLVNSIQDGVIVLESINYGLYQHSGRFPILSPFLFEHTPILASV